MISPDADPPVCRIMNYSKYRYEQACAGRRGVLQRMCSPVRTRCVAGAKSEGRQEEDGRLTRGAERVEDAVRFATLLMRDKA